VPERCELHSRVVNSNRAGACSLGVHRQQARRAGFVRAHGLSGSSLRCAACTLRVVLGVFFWVLDC
jgi:hypothetical protein